jgi:multidrug efflux pump subunit AcrA (membrane-fusion protein)
MSAALNKFVSLALMASSLTLALAGAGCGRPSVPATGLRKEDQPRPVRAVRVRLEPLERTIRSFGSLSAHEQATLSTKVPGVEQSEALLAQARVRLGRPLQGEDDTVDPEKTSGVRQTRAMLEEARANRDRIISLSAQKIIAKSELDSAMALYEVAQSKHEDALQETRTRQALLAQRRAELKIARQQLEDTTIRAPFDAAIQERRANLGEYLPASAPVVTIVRIDPLRLRLEVPERDAPEIEAGQKVRLTLQGTTNVYSGEIKRLSPALDERSRMLRLEADVPNPGSLRPGAFVTADIVVNRTELAVMVPTNSIVTFAGIEKIFVSESGKALEKSIMAGQRSGAFVEVTNGLTGGETVIVDPGNLQNGQAVSVTVVEAEHENPRRAGEETSG